MIGVPIAITLPLVQDKNSCLKELTVRKADIIATATVEDKPDQCVLYIRTLPPMAIALSPDIANQRIFGDTEVVS